MEDKDQWRVKVYELDEQGAWIDVGTGNAELRYVQVGLSLCSVRGLGAGNAV
jgi:hypothetical protein